MKDEKHLRFIRSLRCIRCADDTGTEAAHLRRADARIGKASGIGKKPPDYFTLPLCGRCHRTGPQAQHKIGENAFWEGCHPELWALALYAVSGDHEEGEKIVRAALRFQR